MGRGSEKHFCRASFSHCGKFCASFSPMRKEDVEWRKDVAEKTGLGFALPTSSEVSIGQPGQPEVVRSEEEKAA